MDELKAATPECVRTFRWFITGKIQTLDFTLLCYTMMYYIVNVDIMFVGNKNNEKSMFKHLARDYYHLDNEWCCCYEIK